MVSDVRGGKNRLMAICWNRVDRLNFLGTLTSFANVDIFDRSWVVALE